uniref:BLOC-2 complex member HPS6-like n=1 Tax=Myxine glutinosa TaxID=7769 RepID=UPI00358E6488
MELAREIRFDRGSLLLRLLGECVAARWQHGARTLCVLSNSRRDLQTFESAGPVLLPAGFHYLDISTGDAAVVDVLPLDVSEDSERVLLVVFETGRAECWRRVRSTGWSLWSRMNLCVASSSKVVSVAVLPTWIVWCEERPCSAHRSADSAATLNNCVCKRSMTWSTQGLPTLGASTVLLHSCPGIHVVSTGDGICLRPVPHGPPSRGPVVMLWTPEADELSVVALGHGVVTAKRATELDFSTIVDEWTGCPSDVSVLCHARISGSRAGMLVAASDGNVWLLRDHGMSRCMCTFAVKDDWSRCADTLEMFTSGDTLILIRGKIMTVVDLENNKCFELFMRDKVLGIIPQCKCHDMLSLITSSGLHTLEYLKTRNGSRRNAGRQKDTVCRWVYEEACSYFQTRSVTGSRMSVQQLKHSMGKELTALLAILQEPPGIRNCCWNPEYLELADQLKPLLDEYVEVEELKSELSSNEFEEYACIIIKAEIMRIFHNNVEDKRLNLKELLEFFPEGTIDMVWDVLKVGARKEEADEGALHELWKAVLQEGTCGGAQALFEQICTALHLHRCHSLLVFLDAAQDHRKFTATGSTNLEATPLHLRVLFSLPDGADQESVTLRSELLCRGEPEDAVQGVCMLLDAGQWEQAVRAAKGSPTWSRVLQADVFKSFVVALSRFRGLDGYLDEIWELCPDGMTATEVLRIMLRHGSDDVDATVSERVFDQDDSELTIRLIRPFLMRLLLGEIAECKACP